MKLIDADALIDELTQRCCKNCVKRMGIKNGKRKMIYEIGDAPCLACEVDDMKVELDEAPTIEAEPVRHGRWIIIYNDNKPFKAICSECGAVLLFTSKHEGEPKYCHNCGCKMDKEST